MSKAFHWARQAGMGRTYPVSALRIGTITFTIHRMNVGPVFKPYGHYFFWTIESPLHELTTSDQRFGSIKRAQEAVEQGLTRLLNERSFASIQK